MAARDPTLERDQPDVGPVSRREWAGYIIWGILAVIVTVLSCSPGGGRTSRSRRCSRQPATSRPATTGRRCRFWAGCGARRPDRLLSVALPGGRVVNEEQWAIVWGLLAVIVAFPEFSPPPGGSSFPSRVSPARWSISRPGGRF